MHCVVCVILNVYAMLRGRGSFVLSVRGSVKFVRESVAMAAQCAQPLLLLFCCLHMMHEVVQVLPAWLGQIYVYTRHKFVYNLYARYERIHTYRHS